MINNISQTFNIPKHNKKYVYIDYSDINHMEYNIDAINNSIGNILTTRKGSVPGKPEFGSDLYLIPFSMMDYVTENTLKLSITSTIRSLEPRITLTKIIIDPSDEYNTLIANICYTYNDTSNNITGEVSVTLGDL